MENEAKRQSNVTVWLTEAEIKALDQKRERMRRACPGAQISRSAYIAELVRKDQQGDEEKV